MARDKEFLKSCQLMDYSLLLVFFRRDEELSFEESGERSSQNSIGSNDRRSHIIPPSLPDAVPCNN
jgi:hypothetical protein